MVVAVKNGVPVVAGKGGDWEGESQEGKVKKLCEHFVGILGMYVRNECVC